MLLSLAFHACFPYQTLFFFFLSVSTSGVSPQVSVITLLPNGFNGWNTVSLLAPSFIKAAEENIRIINPKFYIEDKVLA